MYFSRSDRTIVTICICSFDDDMDDVDDDEALDEVEQLDEVSI